MTGLLPVLLAWHPWHARGLNTPLTTNHKIEHGSLMLGYIFSDGPEFIY